MSIHHEGPPKDQTNGDGGEDVSKQFEPMTGRLDDFDNAARETTPPDALTELSPENEATVRAARERLGLIEEEKTPSGIKKKVAAAVAALAVLAGVYHLGKSTDSEQAPPAAPQTASTPQVPGTTEAPVTTTTAAASTSIEKQPLPKGRDYLPYRFDVGDNFTELETVEGAVNALKFPETMTGQEVPGKTAESLQRLFDSMNPQELSKLNGSWTDPETDTVYTGAESALEAYTEIAEEVFGEEFVNNTPHHDLRALLGAAIRRTVVEEGYSNTVRHKVTVSDTDVLLDHPQFGKQVKFSLTVTPTITGGQVPNPQPSIITASVNVGFAPTTNRYGKNTFKFINREGGKVDFE